MATDPASRDFPAALSDVPAATRVREAFGWMPGVAGLALLAFNAWLLRTEPPAALEGVGVVLALLGALLLGHELRRRVNRTVLVPRGGAIGVYRRRRLAQVIGAGDVVPYALRWINTVQFLALPVTLAGAFLFLSVMPAQRYVADEERLAWLVAGLGAAGTGASLVRTRIVCRHFMIPRGRGREEILLPGAEASRLSR